jgi:predicted nucleic acid-binding protein
MSMHQKIHYFDSSVILRYSIGHKDSICNLSHYTDDASTSVVTAIECFRVLDRWRITGEVSESQLVDTRVLILKILQGLRIISLDARIAELAAQSFPIAIKSLDAIHLATALLLQKQSQNKVTVLTHDAKLALAVRAMDLNVQS